MADTRWVHIKSWHAVADRTTGQTKTRCGRWASSEPVDTLPAGKSCEACLRIIAREGDQ